MYQYRTLENTSFEQLAEYFTGTYPQGDYRWICFDRIGIFFMDDEILARICTGIWPDTVLVQGADCRHHDLTCGPPVSEKKIRANTPFAYRFAGVFPVPDLSRAVSWPF